MPSISPSREFPGTSESELETETNTSVNGNTDDGGNTDEDDPADDNEPEHANGDTNEDPPPQNAAAGQNTQRTRSGQSAQRALTPSLRRSVFTPPPQEHLWQNRTAVERRLLTQKLLHLVKVVSRPHDPVGGDADALVKSVLRDMGASLHKQWGDELYLWRTRQVRAWFTMPQ